MAEAAALQYEPAPRSARRRRLIARAILIAVIGIVIVLGVSVFPRANRRVRILVAQSKCMQFEIPAGTVVFESDPTRAQNLARDGRYTIGSDRAGLMKTPLDRLDEVDPPTQLVCDFRRAIAFLHSRRSPGGRTRLVCVTVTPFEKLWHPLYAEAIVWEPATWSLPRRAEWSSTAVAFVDRHGAWPRVFAGQPDPHDPSHFTIAFEWRGRHGVLDGWLKDDDTVSMHVREPIAVEDGSDAPGPFDHAPRFDLELPAFSHTLTPENS